MFSKTEIGKLRLLLSCPLIKSSDTHYYAGGFRFPTSLVEQFLKCGYVEKESGGNRIIITVEGKKRVDND